MTRWLIRKALRQAFGSNNGFAIDKNTGRIYVEKDIYDKLSSPKQKVLYEKFVREIVNNSNISVMVYNSNYTKTPDNEEHYLGKTNSKKKTGDPKVDNAVEVEISWTTFDDTRTKATGEITVGDITSIVETTGPFPTSTQDDAELFWHGIGHQLSNLKYKLDILRVNSNEDVMKANMETIGYQNLFRLIRGHSGMLKGSEHPPYPGADNSILNQAPTGDPNLPDRRKEDNNYDTRPLSQDEKGENSG